MGCVGPKSVIEVRDGMTFLDLSVRQIEVCPLLPTPSFHLMLPQMLTRLARLSFSQRTVPCPFPLGISLNIAPQLCQQLQRPLHPHELLQHRRGHWSNHPEVL
jgi:hypothetical protein